MAKSRKHRPYVGVDLGGTSLRAGVVARDGGVLMMEKLKTKPEQGAAAVVERMAEAITGAVKGAGLRLRDVGGVGIGVPGPIDAERGVVRLAVNLGPDWTNLPLAAELRGRLGLPVCLDNDVRVGALGEHRHGAGQGLDDMVAIFVGTGVGGGLILGGELRAGWRGSAGEIGHTVVAGANGIVGKTGQPGTVEPLASRSGMERQVREVAAAGRESVVPELIESVGGGRLTSSVIQQALRRKDAVMQEVLAVAQHTLGLLAGNLINTLDPQLIVFGGGVTERLGERFVAPIRRVAYANLINKRSAGRAMIVPAALKDASGVVGAAVLARELLK
ncbi:MAG: ROK family protein [Anaerolineales bacterium]|nr:ROK family protein [Anaerolineales bacterium]